VKGRNAAILHNQVAADSPKDELDVLVQAQAVAEALAGLGYRPRVIPFGLDLNDAVRALRQADPLFVFNLVESVAGDGQLIHLAPALLDHLGLRYTGNGQDAIFVTSNKFLTKKTLSWAAIASPPWMSADDREARPPVGAGTYLLKSVWEHASNWFGQDSIVRVRDADELRPLLERKNRSGRGRFYAERYVAGREFNQAILAGEALPSAEIRFVDYPDDKLRIVDFRAKWEEESFEYSHTQRSFEFAAADRPLLENVRAMALRCWELFQLSGYARIDFRVDDENQPWVLEVNANPCLSPDGGFFAAAERRGLSFAGMVERIVDECLSR
jgi:D-alanine-D-alanine ligase